MEQLFSNNYMTISFVKKDSLIKVKWNNVSEEMSDEEFKEVGLLLLNELKRHAPSRIFSDSRHFLYAISPEMQNWFIEKVIMPSVKISIRKHAELISSDLFAQVSIEQLHDENNKLNYETKYFEDEEKAMAWILEN